MEPTLTANSMFSYEQDFHGLSLDEWVKNSHRQLSNQFKIEYVPLEKGSYMYDNLAVRIGYAFTTKSEDDTAENVAEYIHDGWCMNYVYWRDHSSQENVSTIDDQKAITAFADLDQEEKEKYLGLATYLVDSLYFM